MSSVFCAGSDVINVRHRNIIKAVYVTPDCSGFLMHCFSPVEAGTFVVPEPAEGRAEHTGRPSELETWQTDYENYTCSRPCLSWQI
jgi:hypothetical protein